MSELKKEIADLIKIKVAVEQRGLRGRLVPPANGTMPPPKTAASSGAKISGAELAIVGPVIDLIDDAVLRNTVRSYFSMTSKYQALGMITHERSEVFARYPAIAIRIAELATQKDLDVVEAQKKGFH